MKVKKSTGRSRAAASQRRRQSNSLASRMVHKIDRQIPIAATPRIKTIDDKRNALTLSSGNGNTNVDAHTKQKTGIALKAVKTTRKVCHELPIAARN